MIEVKELEGHKFIRKDGLTQSVIPPLEKGYWKQMIPDRFVPENVLVLGLGAGTVCIELRDSFPEVKIDAVEQSKEMVKLAKREFHVTDYVNEIYQENAFQFVKSCRKKYALIIVDLYDGFNFNLKVITDDFLNSCKAILKEGGYLSVNIPNLDQCLHQFQEVKKSDFNKIYFFKKDSLVH